MEKFLSDDIAYMKMALDLAAEAAESGEVPVGAVVVNDSGIVSSAGNRKEVSGDPLGHAEIIAISEASKKLGRWRLSDCTMYVTLEPCLMCAGAMIQSRLGKVVFGASDPKGGSVVSLYSVLSDSRLNHEVEARGGLMEDESALLLKEFFRQRRGGAPD